MPGDEVTKSFRERDRPGRAGVGREAAELESIFSVLFPRQFVGYLDVHYIVLCTLLNAWNISLKEKETAIR